jgi:hypothetical protein
MNTLMIASDNQGLTFDEATAVAPFALIGRLGSFANALMNSVRSAGIGIGSALRPAQA